MKRWKLWLGVLIIFLSGALIGVLGARLYTKHFIERAFSGGPQTKKLMIMRKLERELSLTATQKAEIERIVTQMQSELSELRLRNKPEVEKIFREGFTAIKTKLSPDQQEKLEVVYQRARKRWNLPPK